MVRTEELEVLNALDNFNLLAFLERIESVIQWSLRRGPTGDWLLDDERRVSCIKSELGRRGML